MTDSIQPQQAAGAFDERTALAELELLADKIQKSRVQREQAVAEFDAFVKAFRHEHLSDSIAASDTERRRLEDRSASLNAAAHASGMTAFLPAPAAEPEPAVAAIPVPVETAATEFVPGRWEPEEAEQVTAPVVARGPRAPRAAHVGVVLAALAVLAVGVLLWKSSSDPVAAPPPSAAATGPSPSAAVAPAPAPVQAPAAVPAPVPAPAAPAGPPRALTIEFVTLRPVWARITVDGQRAFEREFPANQRLPLGADRTIAIRAGDAGAVRLIVDGRDLGVLGKDGQVYNRTFSPTLR